MWYHFMGTQKCPNCHCTKDIVAIKCNAESHIQIVLKCLICGENATLEYSLIDLKQFADDQDFKAEVVKENALKSRTRKEYANDSAFLLANHILPEGMKRRLP